MVGQETGLEFPITVFRQPGNAPWVLSKPSRATAISFSLFKQLARRACSRAAEIAGMSNAINMPMMVITTNNSTSVKAERAIPNRAILCRSMFELLPPLKVFNATDPAPNLRNNERFRRHAATHSLPLGIVSNSDGKIQRFPRNFFRGLELLAVFHDNKS